MWIVFLPADLSININLIVILILNGLLFFLMVQMGNYKIM